ncbi:MFS transporter [Nocardia transvalensis]|uniref:MFS transporter n=1 Tax=Nocardia transvalensis TaxID=37333 RepID=UPI001895F3DC|nr:MFS transporter [Nocardia transvalensis]MBF6329322.1 MFS transporter [Nocardia transvalensis]
MTNPGTTITATGERQWRIAEHALLWAIGLTTFTIGIDTTVVGVALPAIRGGLPQSSWSATAVVVGYTLTFGAFMLSAGHIADRFGRKRVFTWGIGVFAATSALCGLAPTLPVLVVARLAQGVAAAALNSAGMALLAENFRGESQRRAFRIWGAIMGASFAAGPIIGGLATDYVGWRWIFLVNVPVLVACGLVVHRLAASSPRRDGGSPDLFGQFMTVGMGAAVFTAVSAVDSRAWALTAGAAAVGAVCAAGLLGRTSSPQHILDRSYFDSAALVCVTIVPVLFSIAFWCLLIIVPDRLGTRVGADPVHAAFWVLPLTAGLVLAAFVPMTRLRADYRASIGVGFAGLSLGAVVAAVSGSSAGLVAGMAVMGLAAGYMNPDVAQAAIALSDPARSGVAAGLTSTMRQLGFGVGVLGVGAVGGGAASPSAALSPIFGVSAVAAVVGSAVAITIYAVTRAKGN